jgi:hypothetical protein
VVRSNGLSNAAIFAMLEANTHLFSVMPVAVLQSPSSHNQAQGIAWLTVFTSSSISFFTAGRFIMRSCHFL